MPDGTKWSVFFATPFYVPLLTSNLYRERNVPVRPNHLLCLGSILTLHFRTSLPLNQFLTTKLMVTIEYLYHNNQSLPSTFLSPTRERQ